MLSQYSFGSSHNAKIFNSVKLVFHCSPYSQKYVGLICLTPYTIQPCVSNFLDNFQKMMTSDNFLQNIEHPVAYSAGNFVKSSFSEVTKV